MLIDGGSILWLAQKVPESHLGGVTYTCVYPLIFAERPLAASRFASWKPASLERTKCRACPLGSHSSIEEMGNATGE